MNKTLYYSQKLGRVLEQPAAEPPRPRPLPSEPTLIELATNFGKAMERWGKAGFPPVTREQYEIRKATCDSCELWDRAARLGLGKCKAPGCGCTSFKRWLATEVCKHPEGSRWPIMPLPGNPTA